MRTIQGKLKALAVAAVLLTSVGLYADCGGKYKGCDGYKGEKQACEYKGKGDMSCDYKGKKNCDGKAACSHKGKKDCDGKGKQACDLKGKGKYDCYGEKKYKHGHKYRSHHRGDSSRFIIGAVYALDLTNDQQAKIDKMLKDYQDSRNKKFEAFTKEGFNKEAYINARMQMKEDMIKAKADLIENIYTVLNKEQKAELKEEIDDFNELRGKRNGKSCGFRK